jgi:hypothetical protein
VIQGDLGDAEGSETIGFSHGDLCLVVHALDDAAGELFFGAKIVEQQGLVLAEGLGDLLHRLYARSHDRSKVRFITRRAGIVGGQKTGRTVAVMQLAQIRGVVLNLPFGFAPRSLLARKFSHVSDMICVNPIALLGETACASPALSTCIIARIQDAGMLHRCDASAMNAANESPRQAAFPRDHRPRRFGARGSLGQHRRHHRSGDERRCSAAPR